ncbi:MAG: hypothetical protein R3B09_22640 [Nannocystaceae bacterium]
MHWTQWKEIFRARALRPFPSIDTCDEIPASWRAPLAASLAKFQVGEAGEGRIAHQVAHVRLAAIDDDYRAALRLFVKEEGRHARILAAILRAQGGELLRSTWSERLFVRGRRLAGFRLKILVLLAAEVLGIGFYGLCAAHLPDGPTRRALLEIAGDEASHLDFHVDFFRRALPGRAGAAIFTAAWVAIAGAACAVVVVDHRATLRALGIGPRAAIQTFAGLVDRVRREVTEARAPTGTIDAARLATAA